MQQAMAVARTLPPRPHSLLLVVITLVAPPQLELLVPAVLVQVRPAQALAQPAANLQGGVGRDTAAVGEEGEMQGTSESSN